MDLVAATVGPSGLMEHAIFGEDLIDCCPSADGVVFTEDVFKIADEQGRYAAHWFSSEVPSSGRKSLTRSGGLRCAIETRAGLAALAVRALGDLGFDLLDRFDVGFDVHAVTAH